MSEVEPGAPVARVESPSRFPWPPRRRRPAGPEGTAEDIAVQDIAEMEAAERRLPPPEPEPMADPPPRFNLAIFRLAALGLALVLGLALTMVRLFVGGPPSVADLRAQAGVDNWSVLPIGVKDDQPGVAFYDKGAWTGFDIDIAYLIAEDLGFRRQEVKFYAIESEDRARMQATDPSTGKRVPVKMVIASYSITDERKAQGVNFSDPYLYTEQSVVTLEGHPAVAAFRDLAGRKVCSLSTSTSANRLTDAGIDLVSKNRVSECFDQLFHHGVDAISTDAAILAGYKANDPHDKIHHWDLGLDASENWGVNVGVGDSPAIRALQKLVDVTLYRSWKDPHDDRWELAYQDNLQPEIAKNGTTPIAVAEQPPVTRPDVRQLPWENELP
jgi:glutamate transport system substrate-binding protein